MFVLPFDAMRLVSRQGPRPQIRSSGSVVSPERAAALDPSLLEWRTHNGTDWTNDDGETEGTILRAGARAEVLFADNRGGVPPFGGYGNAIVLRYSPLVCSLYGHCREVMAAAGTIVEAGAGVATIGRSSRPGHLVGNAHLHWELVTRWPLRSDQHSHRYDVVASLAAAGYVIDSRGRPRLTGAAAPASAGPAPAPGQPGGPHLDAIIPLYGFLGWAAADRWNLTPNQVAAAAVAWEILESGSMRRALPWKRQDTGRDSALEILAAWFGARTRSQRRP